jgi:hypothetical protein
MSLAANLAKLGKLLLAQASGVINGPTPNAGDNSQAVINSAWFKAEQATEAAQGTAKVATQAITNAGTDDATIVTPKKLRAGFAISLTANGYITFPSWLGGLIIQWGQYNTTGTSTPQTVTYPLAYPTGTLSLVCAPLSGLALVTVDSPYSWSNTGFTVVGAQIQPTSANYSAHNGQYISIGR